MKISTLRKLIRQKYLPLCLAFLGGSIVIGGPAYACADSLRAPKGHKASLYKLKHKGPPITQNVSPGPADHLPKAHRVDPVQLDFSHPFGPYLTYNLMRDWFDPAQGQRIKFWLMRVFAYPEVTISPGAAAGEGSIFADSFENYTIQLNFPYSRHVVKLEVAKVFTNEEKKSALEMAQQVLAHLPFNPLGVEVIRVWHSEQAHRPSHLLARENKFMADKTLNLILPPAYLLDEAYLQYQTRFLIDQVAVNLERAIRYGFSNQMSLGEELYKLFIIPGQEKGHWREMYKNREVVLHNLRGTLGYFLTLHWPRRYNFNYHYDYLRHFFMAGPKDSPIKWHYLHPRDVYNFLARFNYIWLHQLGVPQ